MTGSKILLRFTLTLTIAVAVAPHAALAQHPIADSSIGASLLVRALQLPSAAGYPPGDSTFARRLTRGEVQYARTSTTGMPTTLVFGVRSDVVTRDSLDWNATVFGLRTGFARGNADDDVRLSALELYFGGRNLGHMEGGPANVGAEIVAGRTRFVLGTGITLNTRAGFSITAGAQHMFARTQQPRFALALSLGG